MTGGTSGTAPAIDEPRALFARRVRGALARLHDSTALDAHPLAAIVPDRARGESGGQALRRSLLAAIEALGATRPSRGALVGVRGGTILVRRYVEAAPIPAICGELAIAPATYFREHARAVTALADMLLARWGTTASLHLAALGSRPVPGDAAPRTNVGRPLTALLGRDADLARLRRLLADHRLLTLTGGPGVGKTRLALELAADAAGAYPDGVWFVALEALTDPALVLPTVARTLGVADSPQWSAGEVVARVLRQRELLLVLDNVEHVAESAVEVAAVVAACPGLRVLATSRTALRVAGEQEAPLSPLAVPGAGAGGRAASESPAVRLFLERARAVDPDFAPDAAALADVAELCRRLDGVPLAIELAAASLRALGVREVVARLRRSIELPADRARDRPARQHTLRAAVDWSYALLGAEERRLYRRLAVFGGGWSSTELAAVAGDGAAEPTGSLAELVANSLVARDAVSGGAPRFRMLATVRAHALAGLEESGEADAVRERHARAFLAVAEPSEAGLRSPDQLRWLARLDAELDNLRAALAWAVERRDRELGPRLAVALYWYWYLRGYFREGQRWLAAMLDLVPPDEVSSVRGVLLHRAAAFFWVEGRQARAAAMLAEAVRVAEACGDGGLAARSLWTTSLVTAARGDYDGARVLAERALSSAVRMDDAYLQEATLSQLGALALHRDDVGEASRRLEESRALAERIGDRHRLAHACSRLGMLRLRLGDVRAARALMARGLAYWREIAHPGGIAQALEDLAHVAAAADQEERALRLVGAAAALRGDIGWSGMSGHPFPASGLVSRLGAGTASPAWLVGNAMHLDEALAMALEDDERAESRRCQPGV